MATAHCPVPTGLSVIACTCSINATNGSTLRSAFTRPPMVIAGSWQTCSPPMITMGRCEVQREGHMGGIEREVKPLCDSVYRVSQGDVRIAHQGVATHCATHCATWPLGAEEAWAG